MTKKEKSIYIAFISIVSVLMVLLILLFVMPHGTISFFRMNDVTWNLRDSSLYANNRLEVNISGTATNYASAFEAPAALKLETKEDFEKLNNEITLPKDCFKDDVFDDSSFVIISHEGSYYRQSEMRTCKVKDGVLKLDIVLEDDQILKEGYLNSEGIYYLDFIELDKEECASLTSIKMTERLC